MKNNVMLNKLMTDYAVNFVQMMNGEDLFCESFKTDVPGATAADYVADVVRKGVSFYKADGQESFTECMDEIMDFFDVNLETALILENFTSAWVEMKYAKGEISEDKIRAIVEE